MKYENALSGDLQAASGLVKAGKCVFRGIDVLPDGTNPGTFTVYDSLTASGKVIAVGRLDATHSYNSEVTAVACSNGIYVSITGTGLQYVARYGN